MARSMAFEDLATVVYVWVDDGYQAPAAHGLPALSGGDPVPGLCAGPLPGPHSAPAQPESQFNRRARRLWPCAGTGPKPWGATRAALYLLDTKPQYCLFRMKSVS